MSSALRTLALVLALVPLWAGAAEAIGVITIADGDGFIVRKTQKFELKPGARLFAQDLVHSGPASTLVRAELAKGGIYDFGPRSLGIIRPGLVDGSGKAASVYLLSGWLKLGGVAGSDAASAALLAERLDLAGTDGRAVVSVQPDGFQAFAESGTLSAMDRRLGKSAGLTTVAAGALYAAAPADKATLSARAPASFIQSVPKGFRESIPALQDKFRSAEGPTQRPLGELSYAEAEPWLGGEPAVRNLMLNLWRGQLSADLRQGLMAHIARHPEWRATLFPEKDPSRKPAPAGPAHN